MDETQQAQEEEILPLQLRRNLGDRSYEKRKVAALQIETLVRDNPGKVERVIDVLVHDFCFSTQANQRKGGLIGLAATAIALMGSQATKHLHGLMGPVLKCFNDQESRVRYYACEALYNITKVVRSQVLQFFNEIFDGLCKLYTDPDADVKSGAELLDRLIKDVVTESVEFDVDKFIPLLKERIHSSNRSIRQLLVGWISVLDSVPDIDLLEFLPEFLSGLFDMLSDANKDIRQQAYSALGEFLQEIQQAPQKFEHLGQMTPIIVDQCRAKDNFTRLTSLAWMCDFIRLGKETLLPHVSSMLSVVLVSLADAEPEICDKAQVAQQHLHSLVENAQVVPELLPILSVLQDQMQKVQPPQVPTVKASLQWISMLISKFPSDILQHLDDYIFPILLSTLSDEHEQVVRLDLQVLALIARHSEDEFRHVLTKVRQLLRNDRELLARRGSLIIRQMCVLLDGERIYRALASGLASDCDDEEQDLEFVTSMVQALSLILLTAPELHVLRALLKDTLGDPQAQDLFRELFPTWCHCPVSTFSLCLLSQVYELAARLVMLFAQVEVTVGFLLQIDKLVQLIESPIFLHLRLQLLEPRKHPFLIKSLYGLLMLLPQSSAYRLLKGRLESTHVMGQLFPAAAAGAGDDKTKTAAVQPLAKGGALDADALLQRFQDIQTVHNQKRKENPQL